MSTTHPSQNDDDDGVIQRRTTAAATGVQKPAGARSSVFDVARPAQPPKAPRGAPLDFSKITVHTDVPLPPSNSRSNDVRNQLIALLKGMQPGHMIKLPKSRIPYARAAAKAAGIPIAVRHQGPDNAGIWRLADNATDAA